MWESDLKWVTTYEEETWWWNHNFGHIGGFSDRHEWAAPQNNTDDPWDVPSLRKVAANPDSMVYFTRAAHARRIIDFYDIKPPVGRKWHFSKETFISDSTCDYFPKNYYGKDTFNRKIMLLQAMHMDKLIQRDYQRSSYVKSDLRKAETEKVVEFEDKLDLVTLEQFQAGIGLALALYGVALVVLIVEIVIYNLLIMKAEGRSNKSNDVELGNRREESRKQEGECQKESTSNNVEADDCNQVSGEQKGEPQELPRLNTEDGGEKKIEKQPETSKEPTEKRKKNEGKKTERAVRNNRKNVEEDMKKAEKTIDKEMKSSKERQEDKVLTIVDIH